MKWENTDNVKSGKYITLLLCALSGIRQKVCKIWENTEVGNIKLVFVGQQVDF
jgi:hypothetical protein